MIINLKSTTSLGLAISGNENQVMEAIRFAAKKSASAMGPRFKDVYYRSCQTMVEVKQKAA
ncbi:hypothetical protein ACH50O_11535 [Methylomonas sp. 2BW1-5-20]|uniref:hypothetical protein n=1 Tax=Methylomonas sp. 2BW1-5-20 TaxID=3376686 RepID=UPI00404CACA1